MESRLKERLTGAAILVALIVLVVPEIFHGRRSSPSTPIPPVASAVVSGAHSVPSQSYTINLAPSSGRGAASTPTSPNPGTVIAAPPAMTAPQPATIAPEASGALRTIGAGEAEAHAPRVTGHTPPHTGVSTAGGWVVQLGLFAKEANAQRLARSAQDRGVAAQITRFGPHKLFRVAVSGLANRAAAEQITRRLHQAAMPAAILGPR